MFRKIPEYSRFSRFVATLIICKWSRKFIAKCNSFAYARQHRTKLIDQTRRYRHVRSSVIPTVAGDPAMSVGTVLMTLWYSDGWVSDGWGGWGLGRMLSRARSALAFRNSAEAASGPPSSCKSSSSSERLELLRRGRLASPALWTSPVSFSLLPDVCTTHKRMVGDINPPAGRGKTATPQPQTAQKFAKISQILEA